MRKDGWTELPLHLMTISCLDGKKSREEDEGPETEYQVGFSCGDSACFLFLDLVLFSFSFVKIN